MENTTETRLHDHVESIARMLTRGFDGELNVDDEPMTAFDYLQNVLDIEYIVDNKGNFKGGRILVAFGGPNIWVDTRRNMVDGYWWNDRASCMFDDNIGLNDALEELWNCR